MTGKRLRRIRLSYGMTQSHFGTILRQSSSNISKMEVGKRKVGIATKHYLSKFFGENK